VYFPVHAHVCRMPSLKFVNSSKAATMPDSTAHTSTRCIHHLTGKTAGSLRHRFTQHRPPFCKSWPPVTVSNSLKVTNDYMHTVGAVGTALLSALSHL
jgi:hypothetical protein